MPAVKAKKIRCAGGAVAARNLLGFIIKIGKRKILLAGQFCHIVKAVLRIGCRVIGADGTLTGYAGGLWRKQKLIELERAYADADLSLNPQPASR